MSKVTLVSLLIYLLFATYDSAVTRERVDWILKAKHVVTMDLSFHVFEPGAIAIKGSQIVAVGKPCDVDRKFMAKHVEDMGEKWIMPGLINTHCHLAMNLMRGVADDLKLMNWLNHYIFPLEAHIVDRKYVYEASLVGCAELIKRGVTSVVDMYYYEDQVARAVKEAGLRGWLGETIIDFPAPDFNNPATTLVQTEKWMKQYATDPLVKIIPSPHSCYTCSPKYLKRAKKLADKYHTIFTLHLSENRQEVATIEKKYNQTPVEHAWKIGILGKNTLAAHCVVINDKDFRYLKETNTAVSHNPDSNLKLASGIAPVYKMLSNGIRVGLGTDGAVSNNRLDMFKSMDLAAKLQKVLTGDASVMKSKEVVKMATIEGARCIGADSKLGSLEVGKEADLIVLDLEGPCYEPVYDIYSTLVYAADSSTVVDSMVGGKWVLKERKLVNLSSKRLEEIIRKYRENIIDFFKR